MTEQDALIHLMRTTPVKLVKADQVPDEGVLIVVCGRDHGGLVGARQEICGCGAFMWMSPTAQTMMARMSPVDLLCFDCATKAFTSGGEN